MSWVVIAAVSCLLSGVVLWCARRMREPQGLHNGESSLNHDHDQIRQLYRFLLQYNQSGLAVTKELRRLSWQLDAYCSHEHGTELLAERIYKTHNQFKKQAYPVLLNILRTAESVGFRCDLVKQIEPILAQVVNSVDRLVREGLEKEAIQVELPDIQRTHLRIESILLTLRIAVEEYFTTDLTQMLERLLIVREEEFNRLNIQVNVEHTMSDSSMLCRICSRDLRIVLDGLLDNIMDTATDRDLRELWISFDTNQGANFCRISYSWYRLPNKYLYADRTKVIAQCQFDEQNLVPSRELVQRFGGDLWAEQATYSVGTTIVLRLLQIEKKLVKQEQA